MNTIFKTAVALLLIMSIDSLARQSSCISCHLSGDFVSDTTIAAVFLNADIHFHAGLDCSDCHGGDPAHGFIEQDPEMAMDPAKGYRPPPIRAAIPDFCARCHSDIEYMKKFNPRLPTDQLTLYKTSVHGKMLFQKNDAKVAVCTNCHGAHGILPATDSRSKVYVANIPYTCNTCHGDPQYMRGYTYKGIQIPTDQFDEYARSVHGRLLLEQGDNSAPACNSCHGNHGATPPNLASVSAACGECHASNRDFFVNSPHMQPWIELELPECEQCHGNHLIMPASDSLLGVGEGSLCLDCHDEGSAGYEIAAAMKANLDSLKYNIEAAETVIKAAEEKGVEGGQARFDLGAAKDALIRARSVIHTFNRDRVVEVTEPAIQSAAAVRASALSSLDDLKMRQYGLAISLVLVALLAAGLLIKIRQLDRKANITKSK